MVKVTSQQPESGPGLTRKGQATRQRIVAEAAALMYERGVAGTSTEDVQRAAGVSASQVYYYFTDKKALVRAVIAYQTDAVLGVHTPVLSRLDSIEALEAWRDLIVSLYRERRNQRGCPIGSLSSELSSNDPDARADLAASFNRWERAIRDGLEAMRKRGELRADADPGRLALALLAALQGGLLLTQARRDTAALETVLDAMIDSIRHHQPAPESRPGAH